MGGEEINRPGLTRRELLKFAGLAGTWLATPMLVPNAGARSMRSAAIRRLETDVLVIGGGLAGIFAALRASEAGLRVTLLDKGTIGCSGMSPWAADVAECRVGQGDRPAALARLSRDSEFLNDRRWAELHFENAGRVLEDLRRWGILDVPALRRGPLLVERLEAARVARVECVTVTAFVKDAAGRVAGAVGFSRGIGTAGPEALVAAARVVVSCMGAGGLRGPGFPIWSLAHDGDALAYAAGARITGKEFNDLQPGFDSAAFVGRLRAVAQGPGSPRRAALLDDPFLPDAAPRGLMTLDAHFGAMNGDIDSARDGRAESVPGATLGMGCHKGEGVVSTSHTGAADHVPGLYVAGDALGSMLAGPLPPYRGVSLLASAVQGDLVGRNAAAEARRIPRPVPAEASVGTAIRSMWAPLEREQGYGPAWVLQVLQHAVMPFFMTYIRDGGRMRAALANVTYLREHCGSRLIAGDAHQLRLAHELDHMLLNQEMKFRAALFREESRGSHYREDFPARDDANWLCWVDVFQGADGSMKLEKRPIPSEWRGAGDYFERYFRRFPGEREYLAASPPQGVVPA